jgi:hypothetical protein
MAGIYDERHVLFCDILGFSRAVLDGKIHPAKFLIAFSHLDDAVKEANRHVDPNALVPGAGRPPDYVVTPRAEHFSDSIVISTPATNVNAIWLCQAAAMIQGRLAKLGFLSRGSIATGPLHHSETSVFGPAFIEAALQEKKAKWPRVLVSDRTMKHFRHANNVDDLQICRIRERQLIVKERAGCVRVDPFFHLKFFATHKSRPPHQDVARSVDGWRKTVTAGLQSKEKRVFAKYAWMARRFNESLVRREGWCKAIEIP